MLLASNPRRGRKILAAGMIPGKTKPGSAVRLGVHPANAAAGFNQSFSVFVDAPATNLDLDCSSGIGAGESRGSRQQEF
jgi:hypothetical protein